MPLLDAASLLRERCAARRDIGATRPDVFAADPLMSHPAGKMNWNDPSEARALLDNLKEVASDFDVEIIIRDHFNKVLAFTNPMHRASNSVQKINSPCINFAAVPYPGADYTFALSLGKKNLKMTFEHRKLRTFPLSTNTDAIGIEDLGESDLSVEDILKAEAKGGARFGPTEAVLLYTRSLWGETVTLDQVATAYKLDRKSISTAVSKLVRKGDLEDAGRGRFRMPTMEELLRVVE